MLPEYALAPVEIEPNERLSRQELSDLLWFDYLAECRKYHKRYFKWVYRATNHRQREVARDFMLLLRAVIKIIDRHKSTGLLFNTINPLVYEDLYTEVENDYKKKYQ